MGQLISRVRHRILVGAVGFCFVVLTTSCGNQSPGNTIDPNTFVVKSRQTMTLNMDANGMFHRLSLAPSSTTGSVPINVVNAVSTSMALDVSHFAVPNIDTDSVSFGHVDISALKDNNLKVCGPNNNQKCGHASFRMYTTGVAGPGLWNTPDQYGAPLASQLLNSNSFQTVGLNTAGAVTLQQYTIPNSQNVMRLSDFTQTPQFDVKADFSNAGAGSYSTTLVLEYGLSP